MSNVQLRQFLVSVLLFVYRVYGKIFSGVSLSLYILKIKLDIIFLHCLKIFRLSKSILSGNLVQLFWSINNP